MKRDLFVEHSFDDERKHFRLAWRQRLITTAQISTISLLRTREPVAIERLLNRIEQVLIAKRLRQKLHRTGFHRSHRHRNIAMSGNEDDGKVNVSLGKRALEIETAESRHAHVEDQTRCEVRPFVLQKLLRRRKRRHPESHRSDETLQRLAYRLIVVDHEHNRIIAHDVRSALVGKVNWKTAPRGEFAVAQRRPPCASIIVRLIASPIPMPSGFVVKNASNTLSSLAGSSPSPESLTATTTFSSSSAFELTNNSRAPSLLFAIASNPLTIKFRITCCNCTRSPRTSGKSSLSCRFRST